MEFGLTQEQQMIRDMVREFAQQVIAPGELERDRERTFPLEIIEQLGEMGVLGLPFPEEYGGAGGDMISFCLALMELAAVSPSVALTVAAHVSLGSFPIFDFGTEDQKQEWLVPAARGEAIAAFGLTEPGAGSDAGGTETTAVRDGDEWVLNGRKIYITNGSYARHVVVAARTSPGKAGKGISAFIVPTSAGGFKVNKVYEKMGLHTSNTTELLFDDVRLPAEALLGEVDRGFGQFLHTLDGGRIGIGALSAGVIQGVLERSLDYTTQRVQFGQPVSRFQAVNFKLADMAVALETAQLLVFKAASLKDQGMPYKKAASMAKLYASEQAMKAASEAIQVHGGYGFIEEYEVERFYRDVKLMEIGEGTNEIQRMIIAREIGCYE